jgi:hypothetical protein
MSSFAAEGALDRGDELLSVGAHGDIADGDGDVQPLRSPPPAARLQLPRVPGARVHARAEPRQLLHDRVPAQGRTHARFICVVIKRNPFTHTSTI